MRKPLTLASILCLWLVASPASALDFTWDSDGIDPAWDFPGGNWTLGGSSTLLVPDADDNVFFDTDLLGSGVTLESNLNGSREVLAVTLLGDNAFNITGGASDTLSLGTGAITASLGTDLSPHTISTDVQLLAAGTWDINTAASGGTTLDVTGAISTSGGGFDLTKTGDGTLQVADVSISGSLMVDNGTMNLATGGQVSATSMFIGTAAGLAGTFNAEGTGSVINVGSISVGSSGEGALTLADGAAASGAVVLIGESSSSIGTATVTGTDSTLTSSFTVTVGNSGTGTLLVEDGGTIDSATGIDSIGKQSGSVGDAIVTGTGSTWSNLDSIIVGEDGTGTLLVEAGGDVSNRDGIVASSTGSIGDATVTGAGSTWINSASMYVGGNDTSAGGTGNVTISDNALTAVGDTLTIWDNGIVTQNTSATLLVDDTVTSPTITEGTVIGDTGNGTLLITGGGQLSSTIGYLGFLSGSSGNATVTGSGSAWTNSSSLTVGSLGDGTLLVENGAQLFSDGGSLAHQIGATGNVTVTGSGSTWTNSGNFVLAGGLDTSASLTIQDGGQVSNADAFLSLSSDAFLGSTATVDVTGTNSAWTNTGSVYVGGNDSSARGGATVTLSDNATMAVSDTLTVWDDGVVTQNSTATLLVDDTVTSTSETEGTLIGEAGNGTLLITGGGSMTSSASAIGLNSTATGETTVTGAGSTWDPGAALVVGRDGSGTLLIEDGGEVTSSSFTGLGVSSGSVGELTVTGADSTLNAGILFWVGNEGNGTLIVEDGGAVISTNDADIGNLSGGVGVATVRGAGSSLTTDDDLVVGDEGDGTLLIEAGGEAESSEAIIGNRATGVGNATVTGSGSIWDNDREFMVGDAGTGTLLVADGASIVSGEETAIGSSAGSIGSVTITDAGSNWDDGDEFYVGDDGQGTLLIEAGGELSTRDAAIGNGATGVGNATVTGEDSIWTTNETLIVGNEGTGTLLIADGGSVIMEADEEDQSIVGSETGSTGLVTVTGIDSTWTNFDDLKIGDVGTGTLLIEDGGAISNVQGLIGSAAGGVGTVTVTGADSTWINSSSLIIGRSSGTATLNLAGGLVEAQVLIIANATATGTLNLSDGTLQATSLSFGTGTPNLNLTGGTLELLGDQALGSGVLPILSSALTSADHTFKVTGILSLEDSLTNDGARVEANELNFNNGTLNLNSGTVSAAGLSFGPGTTTLNLIGGTLELTGDQTLGSDILPTLSAALTSPDHTFSVVGALTLEDTLTIDGARVEVGELNIDQFASVDGQSGSLFAQTLLLSDGATLDLSNNDLATNAAFDLEVGIFEIAGTVRGSGTINLETGANVQSTGEIRVAAGERAYFAGSDLSHTNSGHLEAIGDPTTAGNAAELEFDGQLTNAADGEIAGLGMNARFNGGLINQGIVSISFGTSNLFGDVNNTGSIGLAGNAEVTFFDNVVQNGTFDIRSGSTAVIFGDFSGAGGTDGTGVLEVLGTLSPGNSPDVVSFGGDLDLSSSVGTLIELGGLALGEFDRNEVAGLLTLGGDLTVELYAGHTLAPNQQYEIFTAGTLNGTFDGLGDGDLVGNFNSVDLFIDYDTTAGNVTLFTVPEPGTLAMVGMGVLLGVPRRSARRVGLSKQPSVTEIQSFGRVGGCGRS